MTSGLGIDRLIDLFIDLFWWFVPFFVISHYEEAVVLRFGRFTRSVKPGFHWLWPLGIEEVLSVNIKPDAWQTSLQSITLVDGTQLTFSLILLWEIRDPMKLLLEVEDKETVISFAQGLTQQYLHQYNWEELIKMRAWAAGSGKRHGLEEQLTKHTNLEMSEWTGVFFISVKLRDFTTTSFKNGVVRMLGGSN